MMKSICYVDDDREEVQRFREVLRERYIVGAGATLDEALEELRQQRVRKPDIFVLDLYYGPEMQDAVRQQIAEIDDQIQALEQQIRALLTQAQQSTDGGFGLAQEAQAKFPQKPMVFFSRKAFLQDALASYERGLRVLEKPDPNDADRGTPDPYIAAFQRHADNIARSLDRIININTWWARNREWLSGFCVGFFFFLLQFAFDLWERHSGFSAALALILGCVVLGVAWLAKK